MKTINYLTKYGAYALIMAGLVFSSCSKDDDEVVPEEENEVEVITDVKLIFTNVADANETVEARATDPDGAGAQSLQIQDTIKLDTSKTYTLSFEVFNNLETPGEDIGLEIKEEDAEHQFFFSFTEGAFSNPTGDGNIDAVEQNAVVYNDTDRNGNPVGLSTAWTTSSTPLTGNFKVMLQHQPDVKTSTSDSGDGDTDFALPFVLIIQ